MKIVEMQSFSCKVADFTEEHYYCNPESLTGEIAVSNDIGGSDNYPFA